MQGYEYKILEWQMKEYLVYSTVEIESYTHKQKEINIFVIKHKKNIQSQTNESK